MATIWRPTTIIAATTAFAFAFAVSYTTDSRARPKPASESLQQAAAMANEIIDSYTVYDEYFVERNLVLDEWLYGDVTVTNTRTGSRFEASVIDSGKRLSYVHYPASGGSSSGTLDLDDVRVDSGGTYICIGWLALACVAAAAALAASSCMGHGQGCNPPPQSEPPGGGGGGGGTTCGTGC